MSLVIRAYRAEDLHAVRALVAEVLAEFGFAETLPGVEQDLAQIASRYAPPDAGFWVAEVAGEPVGTVAVRPKQGRTCELKRFYLRSSRRGVGFGQALYAHAEAFARARGYETIWLDSSRRFRGAHRLYERNGFELIAELDNAWDDNVYEKKLL